MDIALPHHVARKKIPYLDVNTGKTIEPSSPNGIKLEAFIFDTYKYAKSVCVVRGDRALDFAPVKNAEGAGKDSPDTAREAILSLHARWILQAGGVIVDENDVPVPTDRARCEVSPAVSYAGESLASRLRVRVGGVVR